MATSDAESLIYDVRLSSVVPATITGEGKVHELTNMDLVMKLHYIKGLYFFNSDAARGLKIHDLKSPMFRLLELYYPVSGRIRRRTEDGQPFIKCNDSGVRIVEASCSKTVDEWLALMIGSSLDDQLVYGQVLGPDLSFTPFVFIQFTWFKCGGVSVGLSWAHVLGDIFSASDFINMWGQIMAGQMPPKFLDSPKYNPQASVEKVPFPLKMIDPVGDHWTAATNSKMKTHSFQMAAKKLTHLLSKVARSTLHTNYNVKPFEVLSAILWKSLAKIRGASEPRVVTLCTQDNGDHSEFVLPSNSQVISIVEAHSKVAETDPLELAKIIAENSVKKRCAIEGLMGEKDRIKDDFIVYGANTTFVNLEGANVYGLEIKGHKPVFAYYSLGGVAEGGVFLVHSGTQLDKDENGNIARTVTVLLPEDQLEELKDELTKEWGIYSE